MIDRPAARIVTLGERGPDPVRFRAQGSPFYSDMVDAIVALLVSAALGAAVGLERETWNKPAGLRTHMMVAVGAATFTQVALRLVASGGDPGRIVVGVATGLGFLGAGSIIRSNGRIHGITTASGIWVVGAAGASAGAGQYDIAIAAVALSLVILTVLRKLESGRK